MVFSYVVLSRIHIHCPYKSLFFLLPNTTQPTTTTSFVTKKTHITALSFCCKRSFLSDAVFNYPPHETTNPFCWLVVVVVSQEDARARRRGKSRRGEARVCARFGTHNRFDSRLETSSCVVCPRKFGDIYSSQARVYFCEKTRGGERKARQRNAKKAKR